MRIYLDDKVTGAEADAAAVEAALGRFKMLGHKRLELRRAPNSRLTVSRFESELFLEVETSGRLEGVLLSDWTQAETTVRDYFEGKATKLEVPKLPKSLAHLLIGDVDPNCPFCRAWA